MFGPIRQWTDGWRDGSSGNSLSSNGASIEGAEQNAWGWLSFIIITRAEDSASLERLLQTLPTGVEVCIVYTEPAETEALSEITEETTEEGTRFRLRTWKYKAGRFSFSTARNHSIDLATNDWLFYVDSDDLLHKEYFSDIQSLRNLPPGVGGVECCCAGYQPAYNPGHRGQYYGLPSLRIFRKSTGARFRGLVHEQIGPQLELLRYTIVQSAILVSHTGYVADRETLQSKIERNVNLLCAQLATSDYCREYYVEQLRNQIFTLHDIKG